MTGDGASHQFAKGHELHVENLTWPAVYTLTTSLVRSLKAAAYCPDMVVAVFDPQSAGGYAIASQLASLIAVEFSTSQPDVVLLRIEGRSGSRSVTECPEIPADVHRVLVVDDVSWSGHTMRLAREALERSTSAEIRTCALLTSDSAAQSGNVTYWARISDARDATFPWGTVTPTAEFRQYFHIPGEHSHEVSWAPRPWGYWEQFALNEVCTVRILTIFPNECLSLQYHSHRDEFFIALDDGVVLQIGDKKLTANRGDYVLIPRLMHHRQFAPPEHPVRVLEISFGHYDQVGDIVRLDDKYGRTSQDGSV